MTIAGRVEKNLIAEEDLLLKAAGKTNQNRGGTSVEVNNLSLVKVVPDSTFIDTNIYDTFQSVFVITSGTFVTFKSGDQSANVTATPADWFVPSILAADGSEGAYLIIAISDGGALSLTAAEISYNAENVKLALDSRNPSENTYAALKANFGKYVQDQVVYVKGRDSIGDGGEGSFRIHLTSKTTEVAADEVTTGQGDGGIWVAPTSDLTGASGAAERLYEGQILAAWYGTVSDTTLQAAIDFANGQLDGGEIVIADEFELSSVVTVKNGVVLNCMERLLRVRADADMFHVRPGGQVKNLRYDAETATVGAAYTSNILTLVGDGGAAVGYQGNSFRPWFENIVGKMDLDMTATGVHVLMDGRLQYLQEFYASRLGIRGGGKGIHMIGDDTDNLEYVQGNVIDGIYMHGPRRFLHLEGTSTAGNDFGNGIYQQLNADKQGSIDIDSNNNRVSGIAWDTVFLNITGNGNDLSGLLHNTEVGPALTDTGEDNRASSRSVQYYNKTSVNRANDHRHEFYGQGLIEFRDMMLGQRSPLWTETLTGTATAVFNSKVFGATGGNDHFSPFYDIQCPGAGDTAKLDFNGKGFFKLTQNPNIHFTNYTNGNDGRIIWRVGAYTDANNYVYLEQDFTGNGTDDIFLRVKAGGVETTAQIVTEASTRVNFCTLAMSTTSIKARIKQYNDINSGSAGRVADGALWDSGDEAEITVNIPTTAMEPYVYVEGPNSSNGIMYLLDYQLVAGRKAKE